LCELKVGIGFSGFALLPLAYTHPTVASQEDDLFVHTNVLSVKDVTWPNSTDVRFFGNIQYAEPPVGSARFRPPITKRPTKETIDGSWFGP
jgi:hypothetical protein